VVNRSLSSLVCVLAFAALSPSVTVAADPSPALSLDEATALALRQNPT